MVETVTATMEPWSGLGPVSGVLGGISNAADPGPYRVRVRAWYCLDYIATIKSLITGRQR